MTYFNDSPTPSPFSNSTIFAKKNDYKLNVCIGVVFLILAGVSVWFEGGAYYSKMKKEQYEKAYDRYDAVGGRTYEGFVSGFVYNGQDDKSVQHIELIGSDAPIYLNHPEIPKTSLRDTPRVLEMNRTIFNAMEKTETRYLRVDVTHYYNRVKKDRVNVMMTATIIPPIAAPKPDMDKERTIFRHPDTFEVIPKYLYEEIMAERKEKEDFIEDVLNSLSHKPKDFSRYTKHFNLKK